MKDLNVRKVGKERHIPELVVLLLPNPPNPVEVLLLVLLPKPLPPLPNPPKADMMAAGRRKEGRQVSSR